MRAVERYRSPPKPMVCFLENASALIGVDDISCYNRKKKRPMNEQKRRDYIKKERMANQFAMDILIPKKLILLALEHVKKTEPPSRKYYEAEKIKRARIVDIAKLMTISEPLLTHRIKQLEIDILKEN